MMKVSSRERKRLDFVAEASSEPCQISKTEHLAKIVND